jgi:ribosomal protection tetracycline resistance protein
VNLGILAHVDAGKTSLTERLLHLAGVVDQPGRVDDGSTRTDSLALERRRGITIKSAVVSFALAGGTVNLIDTPGHPDFIAEVERVLGVLDGAVLVVSAVEGVQAQTRILHRTLTRLRIPTLIMVNKVDRRGARPAAVLARSPRSSPPAVVPVAAVDGAGTRAATVTPREPGDPADRDGPASPAAADDHSDLAVLAEHDDALLAAYVEGRPVPSAERRAALRDQTGARASTRVLRVGDHRRGRRAPGHRHRRAPARRAAWWPAEGTVFKVERGPAGERVAYVRMLAGAVRLRDRVLGDVVTGLDVFADGALERRPVARAGEIAQLRGLTRVRIGDAVGLAERPSSTSRRPAWSRS